MENQSQIEMPRYRSHKVVHALKIREIHQREGGGATITPDEVAFAPFFVDAEYVRKHLPLPGGYYVVYPDGYKSWSPAEAFESGYTRIE